MICNQNLLTRRKDKFPFVGSSKHRRGWDKRGRYQIINSLMSFHCQAPFQFVRTQYFCQNRNSNQTGKKLLWFEKESNDLKWIQSPRLFWARIMLKWANKYLEIQRLQSWSVYGDSNSFSMVVSGKKMNCQKVAPFLWNLPTFKKRTHQFWDSKVSGAFPGGLWAKVLLSKCLLQ